MLSEFIYLHNEKIILAIIALGILSYLFKKHAFKCDTELLDANNISYKLSDDEAMEIVTDLYLTRMSTAQNGMQRNDILEAYYNASCFYEMATNYYDQTERLYKQYRQCCTNNLNESIL